jgi:hypothetical protein
MEMILMRRTARYGSMVVKGNAIMRQVTIQKKASSGMLRRVAPVTTDVSERNLA